MSKFITINVLVGSRKGTETLLLCRALKAMEKVCMIDFSCYQREISSVYTWTES